MPDLNPTENEFGKLKSRGTNMDLVSDLFSNVLSLDIEEDSELLSWQKEVAKSIATS